MGIQGVACPELADKTALTALLIQHQGVVRSVARHLKVRSDTVWDHIAGDPEMEAVLAKARAIKVLSRCELHEETLDYMAVNKAEYPSTAFNCAKLYLTVHDGRYKVSKESDKKEEVKQFVKEVLQDILGNNNDEQRSIIDITAESDIQGTSPK